jgi:prephenate dehydrogenase
MAGSLAMRLKADHVCREVVALVRREEAVREAEQLGAVDWATTNPARALKEADIVIFGTPVQVLMAQLQDFAPFFKTGAIITDMGSTKQKTTDVLTQLPSHVYPIGSHPMCGKEISGLVAAEAGLYEDATWVISPLSRTPEGVVEVIKELALAIGSKPIILEPARHDKLVATISHIPYLLSTALVLAAQSVAEEDEVVWQVAASGFKDTSRLAGSSVHMMLDILLTNRDAVVAMMERLQQQLDTLTDAVTSGNEESLRTLLQRANNQRYALYPAHPHQPD